MGKHEEAHVTARNEYLITGRTGLLIEAERNLCRAVDAMEERVSKDVVEPVAVLKYRAPGFVGHATMSVLAVEEMSRACVAAGHLHDCTYAEFVSRLAQERDQAKIEKAKYALEVQRLNEVIAQQPKSQEAQSVAALERECAILRNNLVTSTNEANDYAQRYRGAQSRVEQMQLTIESYHQLQRTIDAVANKGHRVT
jgi:hypothetical protein